MNNEKLYYFDGTAGNEKQNIAMNAKKTLVIKDIGTEVTINDVKGVEIDTRKENTISINLSSKGTILFINKKLIVQDKENYIHIIIMNSEEQINEYQELLCQQGYNALISYILQYTPNLFTREKLEQKSIEELEHIKEKVFELANSY